MHTAQQMELRSIDLGSVSELTGGVHFGDYWDGLYMPVMGWKPLPG